MPLSRKKRKGSPTISPIIDAKTIGDSLIFWTDHPKSSIKIDMTELSTGNGCEKTYFNRIKRFKGRPTLIKELAPAIFSTFRLSPATTARSILPSLRTFWTLFDEFEHEQEIHSVTDIDDFTGFLQQRAGISASQRALFLRVLNVVREKRGIPILYWTTNDVPMPSTALPIFEHVKEIYHVLKHRATQLRERWEKADRDAAVGTDWSGGLTKRHSRVHGYWSAAENHATFRGIVLALKHPCPSKDMIGERLATPNATAVKKRAEALYGLYPSMLDTQYLLYLFILKTGWNATTALAIDIEDYLTPHPIASTHHVIHSYKARGNTEQIAIGLNKSLLSPGGILSLIIERTKPLRERLISNLRQLYTIRKNDGSNPKLDSEIKRLESEKSSPWLFIGISSAEPRALTNFNCLLVTDGHTQTSGLRLIIRDINQARSVDKHLSYDITLTSLRDSYISHEYETSGYSWLVAKLAAGHKSMESLKSYLASRHFKAHGDRKVKQLTNILWSEIRLHRCVDPAILRARMDRGELTEAQRLTLTSRTRVGTGCSDFENPPKYLAPNHNDGDGCRIQRCTLCHHAVLFDDSYEFLARRVAELEHIHRNIPFVSWSQSSYQLELDNAMAALSQFDNKLVQSRIDFWKGEIEAGRHRPILQEGDYLFGTSEVKKAGGDSKL